jgi:hypothetical protein
MTWVRTSKSLLNQTTFAIALETWAIAPPFVLATPMIYADAVPARESTAVTATAARESFFIVISLPEDSNLVSFDFASRRCDHIQTTGPGQYGG